MRTRILPLLIVALVAAACGGSGETTTTTLPPPTTAAPATTTTLAPTTTTSTTTTSTTTTTLPPPPSSPLNGIPADDPALLERRVIAVKIDNHNRARPQSGLEAADAVIEIRVEGGITRFVALFHDNDVDYLGPVRSGRPTDGNVLSPLGATFGISGAQRWISRYIANRDVNLLGEGPGMFRIRGRRAPHNLYADTVRLREAADSRGYSNDPPPDLWEFGEFVPSESAGKVRLPFSDGSTITWEWDGTEWLRFHNGGAHEWRDNDGNSGQISADVLVVLEGSFYTAYDPAGQGNAVPATETIGRGPAWVFAEGGVARGWWERREAHDWFTLTDEAGAPMAVPAGRPWISVFPFQRDVTFEPYEGPPPDESDSEG